MGEIIKVSKTETQLAFVGEFQFDKKQANQIIQELGQMYKSALIATDQYECAVKNVLKRLDLVENANG